MFILANFLAAAAKVLEILFTMLYWLILVRALVSWVNPDPFNPVVQFLHRATEPILSPIRKFLPMSFRYGIDVSPVIAFLFLIFLKIFAVRSLEGLAFRLR